MLVSGTYLDERDRASPPLCTLHDWQQFSVDFFLQGYDDLPLFDSDNTILDTSTIAPEYSGNEFMMQSLDDLVVDTGSCWDDQSHLHDTWTQSSNSAVADLGMSATTSSISPAYTSMSSTQQSPAPAAGAAMFPSFESMQQTQPTSICTTSHSQSDRSEKRAMGSPSSGSDSPHGPTKVFKRQRNTEAARRYRQRKLDRLSEVEEALRDMTNERDELRLKLARSEAEADVLRGMVRK